MKLNGAREEKLQSDHTAHPNHGPLRLQTYHLPCPLLPDAYLRPPSLT